MINLLYSPHSTTVPCTGTPAESDLEEFMASFWPENELCELLCISLFCPANSEVIADCQLINVSDTALCGACVYS